MAASFRRKHNAVLQRLVAGGFVETKDLHRLLYQSSPSTIHTVEPLKHECGVAMIRLRQPLNYYQE